MAGLSLAPATPAEALDFKFEFINKDFWVPGVVQGRIIGLHDNMANQHAVGIFIDRIPAGYSTIGAGYPNDASLWPTVGVNLFTVQNGEITSFEFSASTYDLHVPYTAFSFQGIQLDPFSTWFAEDVDLSGGLYRTYEKRTGSFSLPIYKTTTFTPIPEPSTVILMVSGLARLLAWRLKNSALA